MSPRPDRRPDSRPDRGVRRGDSSAGSRSRFPNPRSMGPGSRGPKQRWQGKRDSEDRTPWEKGSDSGRTGGSKAGDWDRSSPPRRSILAGRDRRPQEGRASIIRRGPDRLRSERRPVGPSIDRPPGPQRRSAPITDPTATAEGVRERGEADSYAGSAPKDLIWGRHSVEACLESGRPIHRVWCTSEMRFTPRFLGLLRDAKASGVLVEEVTWARLGQITGGAVHQGIVLQPAAAPTLDLPSLIQGCRSIGESPLLIAVDGLTDPQNLGAIVRSAEALGAHGMVLPQRRNAGLTGSVAKVAAGALEHLPVARVVNLNRSLDLLKQEGYRVVGLAEEGSVSLEQVDLQGPLVIVTGSEGDGLSMLTRRTCDQLVRIPLRGSTPSLNASVATALLLYEVARRGWMRGLGGCSPAPRIVRPSLPNSAPEDVTDSRENPETSTIPPARSSPSPAPAAAAEGSTAAFEPLEALETVDPPEEAVRAGAEAESEAAVEAEAGAAVEAEAAEAGAGAAAEVMDQAQSPQGPPLRESSEPQPEGTTTAEAPPLPPNWSAGLTFDADIRI
jgi:23S rRNA (guanosine2251-2'-O)-methyltransferase